MASNESSHRTFPAESYDIRPAKDLAETKQIWWPFMLKLGWDRGPDELETYMVHSHSRGMILVFPKRSSTPVGHIAAVINDNSTGWVALFIVDDQSQGRGLGAGLWNDMMGDFRTAETSIIGLDAVPQQQGTYERRGFVMSELGSIRLMTRKLLVSHSVQSASNAGHTLAYIRAVSPEQLAQYELKYTGFFRPNLWKHLLGRKDVVGFVVGSGDALSGCILMRRCPSGCRIGPVYAESPSHAEALLRALLEIASPTYIEDLPMQDVTIGESLSEIAEKAQLVVEVWSGNPAAMSLFESLGWREAGYFYRMWYQGRATDQQSRGGAHEQGQFAILDAAIG